MPAEETRMQFSGFDQDITESTVIEFVSVPNSHPYTDITPNLVKQPWKTFQTPWKKCCSHLQQFLLLLLLQPFILQWDTDPQSTHPKPFYLFLSLAVPSTHPLYYSPLSRDWLARLYECTIKTWDRGIRRFNVVDLIYKHSVLCVLSACETLSRVVDLIYKHICFIYSRL